MHAVRVFLMLRGILRNIRRIVHGLEQVKKREDKCPNKIDKVPEKSADLDAVGEMCGIALINCLTHGEPHVEKSQSSAEHVQAMQSRNREVAREIGVVPRAE